MPISKLKKTHALRVFSANPTPRLELSTIDAVRREMARLYRDAKCGNIPTADASRLAFILAQIGKLIETSALETRLSTLEKTYDQRA